MTENNLKNVHVFFTRQFSKLVLTLYFKNVNVNIIPKFQSQRDTILDGIH